VATHYRDFEIGGAWGDPSGTAGEEGDTYFDILRKNNDWKWYPAPTNDPEIRQEGVKLALNRMVDGKPGFQLSPACKMLRKGFASGYHFKFVRSSNGTQTHETPAKNAYSHPHDALQYLMLGGGEYDVVHNMDPEKRGRRAAIAEGVNDDPFGSTKPVRAPQYTNEKTMREMRHRSVKRPAIAKGVDDGAY
jgi:hypothetical protein